MKGQMELMEYVIMGFFLFIMIIVLIFFFTGFQVTQLSQDAKRSQIDQVLTLAKQVSSSPVLVKEIGVFDDAKLTGLASLEDSCKRISSLFGQGWFFEVRVLDGKPDLECTETTYPHCNYWAFCARSAQNTTFDLPVNIVRVVGLQLPAGTFSRTDLGLLRVGVYEA